MTSGETLSFGTSTLLTGLRLSVHRYEDPRAIEAAPVAQGVGGQLGVIVTVEEPRRGLTLGDQPVQDGHGGVGVDPTPDGDGEGFAGVVVDDVEQQTSR